MCALRGTARTTECPAVLRRCCSVQGAAPLRLLRKLSPAGCLMRELLQETGRVGKMISCSRHDTKACFPMNCHARISHRQGHGHSSKKRAKLIPRTHKQKRPPGTRSRTIFVRSKGFRDAALTSKNGRTRRSRDRPFSHVCATMHCLPVMRGAK